MRWMGRPEIGYLIQTKMSSAERRIRLRAKAQQHLGPLVKRCPALRTCWRVRSKPVEVVAAVDAYHDPVVEQAIPQRLSSAAPVEPTREIERRHERKEVSNIAHPQHLSP